jgi:monoamine oxidase
MTTGATTGVKVSVQRWPLEPFVSGQDTRPSQVHPHPHPVPALGTTAWEGKLLFAGTESDQESPGVMEGAVGAAKRALAHMKF